MRRIDQAARRWILERASGGEVFTNDVARHFKISMRSAAGRLTKLRNQGLIEAVSVKQHARIGSEITDEGRAVLLRGDAIVRRAQFNFKPICRALGEGMRL